MANKKLTYFRKFYNWSIKHWVISALLPLSSSIFLFLSLFGTNFGLRRPDGTLPTIVLVIGLILFVISIVYSGLKGSADKWNEKTKYHGQKVLGHINSSLNSLKEYKYRRIENFIKANSNHTNPFLSITQPRDQIEIILANMRTVLGLIFGIEKESIGVSILIKIDDNDWDWVQSINIKESITKEELVENKRTTSYHIINGHDHFLFFPNKKTGIEKGMYVPDALDKSSNNVGSIFCSDISVDKEKVRAILSISTYSTQLCREADMVANKLLVEKIFPAYEIRLKVELALLYIKEVIYEEVNLTTSSS